MLSERSLHILRKMVAAEAAEDYEGAEIVCSGIICYLDEERISRRTVDNLLRHVAVKSGSEPGELERYRVSGTGRAIAGDPAVADKVLACVLRGIPCDEQGNPIS